MNRFVYNFTLICLTVVVWGFTYFVAKKREVLLFARANLQVQIQTNPEYVKLTVDSKPVYKGLYVQTPLRLNLANGDHKIKIKRRGYFAHTIIIENGKDVYNISDVVLESDPNYPAIKVDFVAAEGSELPPTLKISVDENFIFGDLPIYSNDLAADEPHQITIFPFYPQKRRVHRCKINLPKSEEPHLLKITRKNGKFRLSNCK